MEDRTNAAPAWQALAFEMFFSPTTPYMATVGYWLRCHHGYRDATDERVRQALKVESIRRAPRGLPSVMRLVSREAVRLFARTYSAPELVAFHESRVLVCYDPQDMASVTIMAGVPMRAICVAKLVPATPATITDTRIYDERLARQTILDARRADIVADSQFLARQAAQQAARRAANQGATLTDSCMLDVMVDSGDGSAYRPVLTVSTDRESGAIQSWQIGSPQMLQPQPCMDARSKGHVEMFFREFTKTLAAAETRQLLGDNEGWGAEARAMFNVAERPSISTIASKLRSAGHSTATDSNVLRYLKAPAQQTMTMRNLLERASAFFTVQTNILRRMG